MRPPAGSVALPNDMLEELGSGDVSVSFEKNGDEVSIRVSVDGESLAALPGEVKAAVPLGEGEVAVLVERMEASPSCRNPWWRTA